VNPIRPNGLPQTSVPQRPADPARLAAQRAFFEAALGKAPAAATAVAARPAQAAAPLQRTPDPASAKPEKILRPGSLLDIRV
jgi:hypothetical protein